MDIPNQRSISRFDTPACLCVSILYHTATGVDWIQVPDQINNYDCGVHLLAWAEHIIFGRPVPSRLEDKTSSAVYRRLEFASEFHPRSRAAAYRLHFLYEFDRLVLQAPHKPVRSARMQPVISDLTEMAGPPKEDDAELQMLEGGEWKVVRTATSI